MTISIVSGLFLFAGWLLGYSRTHPLWLAVPVAIWIGLELIAGK